jgi:peptidoglycan/xylan/chitin deacetylase (PgdA/CDA1 family)
MGTVVLSVDAELGWGFHDYETPPRDRLAAARSGWRTLLDLLDRYELPATWAVVGHLLLADCDGRHDDHPAPADWFAHERGSDRMPRRYRFADGLVTAIQEASVDHDVGSHTFSHVEFGAPETTRELARAEVAASIESARERDLPVRSFVFPRNNVGHLDALAAYGVRCYRGPRAFDPSGNLLYRARVKLGGGIETDGPTLETPHVDSFGLVNVPPSLYLFGLDGAARKLLEPFVGDPIVRQAKRGIDAAATGDGVFHLWLHPNNVTGRRDERRLRRVFEHVARRRADSPLRVETMAAVAERTLAAEAAESEPA